MKNKPNDRLASRPPVPEDVDPRIFVIVNGKKFPRPALENVFCAGSSGEGGEFVVWLPSRGSHLLFM